MTRFDESSSLGHALGLLSLAPIAIREAEARERAEREAERNRRLQAALQDLPPLKRPIGPAPIAPSPVSGRQGTVAPGFGRLLENLGLLFGAGIWFVGVGGVIGLVIGIPNVGLIVGLALTLLTWVIESEPWRESREESKRLLEEAEAQATYEKSRRAYDRATRAADERDRQRAKIRESFENDSE